MGAPSFGPVSGMTGTFDIPLSVGDDTATFTTKSISAPMTALVFNDSGSVDLTAPNAVGSAPISVGTMIGNLVADPFGIAVVTTCVPDAGQDQTVGSVAVSRRPPSRSPSRSPARSRSPAGQGRQDPEGGPRRDRRRHGQVPVAGERQGDQEGHQAVAEADQGPQGQEGLRQGDLRQGRLPQDRADLEGTEDQVVSSTQPTGPDAVRRGRSAFRQPGLERRWLCHPSSGRPEEEHDEQPGGREDPAAVEPGRLAGRCRLRAVPGGRGAADRAGREPGQRPGRGSSSTSPTWSTSTSSPATTASSRSTGRTPRPRTR